MSEEDKTIKLAGNWPFHHDYSPEDHTTKKRNKQSTSSTTTPQDKRDFAEDYKKRIKTVVDKYKRYLNEPFIKEKWSKGMLTPMQFASKYGVADLAEYLLDKNADPNRRPAQPMNFSTGTLTNSTQVHAIENSLQNKRKSFSFKY